MPIWIFKFVWRLRILIYLIGIATFIGIYVGKILITLLSSIAFTQGFCLPCEVKEGEPEKEEFWPADMIPHPTPPWERPKKPSDGDLA